MPRFSILSLLSVALVGGAALALPGVGAAHPGGGGHDRFESPTAAASATSTVAVRNNRFSPGRLTIRRGSRVIWKWRDGGVRHNVTPARGGRGSGTSSRKGHRFSKSFTRRGTFKYVCTIHPAAMRLTVKVR
jgi:plastocyanin